MLAPPAQADSASTRPIPTRPRRHRNPKKSTSLARFPGRQACRHIVDMRPKQRSDAPLAGPCSPVSDIIERGSEVMTWTWHDFGGIE